MGAAAERDSHPSWDMAPFSAAEDRILEAAALAEQRFSDAHLLWCKLQQSAQGLKDGGRFELSRGLFAKLADIRLAAIDALLAAFSNVGLIVDGRLETYVERKLSGDQKYRRNKKAKEEAERAAHLAASEASQSEAHPAPSPQCDRDAESPNRVAAASRNVATASRNRTESSESSPTETIRVTESHPSVVVCGDRAGETTTDEEILEAVSRIDQAKIPAQVMQKGLSVLRDCVTDQCDLKLDVVPALTEIATYLDRPLRTLQAAWVGRQIRERRDRRISGPPAAKSGAPVDYEQEYLRELQAAGNA